MQSCHVEKLQTARIFALSAKIILLWRCWIQQRWSQSVQQNRKYFIYSLPTLPMMQFLFVLWQEFKWTRWFLKDVIIKHLCLIGQTVTADVRSASYREELIGKYFHLQTSLQHLHPFTVKRKHCAASHCTCLTSACCKLQISVTLFIQAPLCLFLHILHAGLPDLSAPYLRLQLLRPDPLH